MDRVTASRVFVSIVEQRSMVGASNALGISRSMVTRYLAEMESWANTRLLHRTTRKMTLTPAGENVLKQCKLLLETAQKIDSVSQQKETTGLIRVSCSQFIGAEVLAPLSAKFLSMYPKVSLELVISNQTVNLVADRIDMAIRITNHLDPNLIARKLSRCQSLLCATPAYIEQHGNPQTLEALGNHQCFTYAYFGNQVWHFEKDNIPLVAPIQGNFCANESTVLLQHILQDTGIAMLPRLSVLPYIKSGELINILPDYQPMPLSIHCVYHNRAYMNQALRKFIDFLAHELTLLDL